MDETAVMMTLDVRSVRLVAGLACAMSCVAGATAVAQDKPFVFSVTTAPDPTRHQARVDYQAWK
ncbi:MAG TPA: hypothetical protein VGI12_16920 [Vicinamibacterales bacterium]|jgi:hypothetical protein